MSDPPDPIASKSSAAMRPAPDAPAWSAVRVTAMSTRPAAASIRGVNVVGTLPCRMKVPSCTVRTRNTFGLNVTVSVMTDTRDALLIDSGTVYGPPATRNSVPGGVTRICAAAGDVGPAPAAPGGAGGVAFGSRGGGAGATGTPAGGCRPTVGAPGTCPTAGSEPAA